MSVSRIPIHQVYRPRHVSPPSTFNPSSFFLKMKSTPRLWTVLSYAMLAAAMPAISNRALRIPLQRRSLDSVDPMSVQSDTGEQFLGARRVAQLISYAHECVFCSLVICLAQLPGMFRKYTNTFAAYEQNAGSRHPLDTLSRSSPTRPSKRASNGSITLYNDQASLWYGNITIGTPPQNFTGKASPISSGSSS